MYRLPLVCLLLGLLTSRAVPADSPRPSRFRGEVVDAATGQPLACRVYVQARDGTWYFPRSESPTGSAIPYRKQREDAPRSVELHTTLSAHPFILDLAPGRYTFTVERGKEYFPLSCAVDVEGESLRETFRLRRWIDVAARGWYSGDTHVHRTTAELPNLLLAEDLNVAFPLSYWVTEAYTAPRTAARSAREAPAPAPVAVDPTHVYYAMNTEYEIFTVDHKPHMLGAVFVLNHRTPFAAGVPPVVPVARRARSEGGLLELDKHNWPWSMAIVPVLNVDLYELANNHCWRTPFAYTSWAEREAAYMHIERDALGWTEGGWIDFGLQNYYALLDCGFRLRPTAGTASGVHPVPLGFGRVYVHLPGGFTYADWLRGLNEGRSFVTTGPMLFAQVNGQDPGHVFAHAEPGQTYHVTGTVVSPAPLGRIELIVNGTVLRRVQPANRRTDAGALESPLDVQVPVNGSGWIAVRCFEDRPDGRVRFAHTGPWHVEVPGKPLRPRREEAAYLIQRVEEQLRRSAEVLPQAALDEYREALRIYQGIASTAR